MKKTLLVYSILVVLLLSSIYATDFFQMPPGHQSVIYTGGTEDYINYRIRNTELSFIDDLRTYSGFNYGYFIEEGYAPEFKVYLSASGFYGSSLKLIYSLLPIPADNFLSLTRILFAIILAGILAKLAVTIQQTYGWVASVTFVLFCASTYWLIGPSKHLVWFYFLLFLPLVYSIYAYPRLLEGDISKKRFFIGLFIVFTLVFLLGYTYISCLALSPTIPVVYHQLQKKKFRKLLWHGIAMGLISLAAYVLVLSLHYIQLLHYLDEGKVAFTYLLSKALFRLQGQSTQSISMRDLFLAWSRIKFFYFPQPLIDFIPQWLKNVFPLNMIRTLYMLLGVNLSVTLIFSFFLKKKESIEAIWRERIDDLVVIGLTCAVSLVASWSWFIAKGHMVAHPHMNGIMFVIPFGLTLFFYTGVLLQFVVDYLRRKHSAPISE